MPPAPAGAVAANASSSPAVAQAKGLDEPGERAAGEPAGVLDEEAPAGVAVRLDEAAPVDRRTVVQRAHDLGRAERAGELAGLDQARAERVREVVAGADRDRRAFRQTGERGALPVQRSRTHRRPRRSPAARPASSSNSASSPGSKRALLERIGHGGRGQAVVEHMGAGEPGDEVGDRLMEAADRRALGRVALQPAGLGRHVRGVQDDAGRVLHPLRRQARDLGLGAPVHPDDAGPERLALPVDGEAAVELAADAERPDRARRLTGGRRARGRWSAPAPPPTAADPAPPSPAGETTGDRRSRPRPAAADRRRSRPPSGSGCRCRRRRSWRLSRRRPARRAAARGARPCAARRRR